MTMKNKILILLFILYFFTFIASPLSYAFEDGSRNPASLRSRQAVDGYRAVSENIRIFLLDLLCSNFIPKKTDTRAPTIVSFLIKKKRALVRSNSLIKLPPVEYDATGAGVPYLLVPDAPGAAAYCPEASLFRHFYSVSSGLSPPSATA
jgi:hypothetical protein